MQNGGLRSAISSSFKNKKMLPMHTIIIGGTGHAGTYLVPRLVEAGYEVTVVSRGNRSPYTPHNAWKKVRRVLLDRKAEEANGIIQ